MTEVYILVQDTDEHTSVLAVHSTLEGAKASVPESEVKFSETDELARNAGLVLYATGYFHGINWLGKEYRGSNKYLIEKHTVQP